MVRVNEACAGQGERAERLYPRPVPEVLLRAAEQARQLREFRAQFEECVPDRPARKPRPRRVLTPAEQSEALRRRVAKYRAASARWRERHAMAWAG